MTRSTVAFTVHSMSIRVTLQQPALPAYRVPIFRELARRPGIDLHVVYGQLPNLPNVAPDGFRVTFVPQKFISVGPRTAVVHSPQIAFASKVQSDVLILSWDLHQLTLVPALLRARRAGVGTILWGHGYSRSEAWRRKILRDQVGKLADALLFYGDRTADTFAASGFDRSRLFVARNALDQSQIDAARDAWLADPAKLDAFRREQRLDGPVLLFVSRLLPENRLDLLLEAAAKLTRFPTLQVVLIGAGDEGPLREQAGWLGLDSRVRFVGPMYDEPQLAPYFLTAAAFVYPAKLGLSLHHAFGYGLPLITSADESAQMPEREALREGVNGLTYADGDADDLARAIAEMLADPARRRAMGEAALRTVREDYSVGKMIDGFAAAIRFVASRHGSP